MISNNPILQVRDLKVYFPGGEGIFFRRKKSVLKAVDGVTFSVKKGKILGLVGESGCGKSTIARAILRLVEPTQGEIIFKGEDLCRLEEKKLRVMRRYLQIIFQDPYASLNPSITVGQIVGELMHIHRIARGKEKENKVKRLLQEVGLSPYHIDRYPHEFSGGQRQRIGIARTLAVNPEFIVADEPVSALDVSIQAQIINLLQELQEKFNLTYLFISHDLSVVRHISDRIAVMYLGKIVELADKDEFYHHPLHPYTQALLSAVPIPDPEVELKRKRIILSGDVPSPINLPNGCYFHTRCWKRMNVCEHQEPEFREVRSRHFVACHLYDNVKIMEEYRKPQSV